jgi:importin subunit alpha-6/7
MDTTTISSVPDFTKEVQREYKQTKGLDTTTSRRKREENAIELRKNKREDQIEKRRMLWTPTTTESLLTATTTTATKATIDAVASSIDVKMEQQIKEASNIISDEKQNVIAISNSVNEVGRMLCEQVPPIKAIAGTAIPFRLIQFLNRFQQPTLLYRSLYVLANIAGLTYAPYIKTLCDKGLLTGLRGVLEYATATTKQASLNLPVEILQQTVFCLGNIMASGSTLRDLVLIAQPNMIPLLLKLKHLLPPKDATTNNNFHHFFVWSFANALERDKKEKPPATVLKETHSFPIATVLCQLLLEYTDPSVVKEALRGLVAFTDDEQTLLTPDEAAKSPPLPRLELVIKNGVVPRLAQLFLNRDYFIAQEAATVFANLTLGTYAQTDRLLVCKPLLPLKQLIDSLKTSSNKLTKEIRRNVCFLLSNIALGTTEHIQAVLDSGILPSITGWALDAPLRLQKDILHLIHNIAGFGNHGQKLSVLEQYHEIIFPFLCELTKCDQSDLVLISLKTIESFLEFNKKHPKPFGVDRVAELIEMTSGGRGLDQLGHLLQHENDEVFQKAEFILQTYFNETDTTAAAAGDLKSETILTSSAATVSSSSSFPFPIWSSSSSSFSSPNPYPNLYSNKSTSTTAAAAATATATTTASFKFPPPAVKQAWMDTASAASSSTPPVAISTHLSSMITSLQSAATQLDLYS